MSTIYNPMTTAAAIDRLVHHSVILELNISSYRMEQAKKIRPSRKANDAPIKRKWSFLELEALPPDLRGVRHATSAKTVKTHELPSSSASRTQIPGLQN
jgi:hypothetical protein